LLQVVALILYTGPMYVRYNGVLRGVAGRTPGDKHNSTLNLYATTIMLIVSGLLKLSRFSPALKSPFVYRGFGDVRLPDNFFAKDGQGRSGGVEFGCTPHSPPP